MTSHCQAARRDGSELHSSTHSLFSFPHSHTLFLRHSLLCFSGAPVVIRVLHSRARHAPEIRTICHADVSHVCLSVAAKTVACGHTVQNVAVKRTKLGLKVLKRMTAWQTPPLPPPPHHHHMGVKRCLWFDTDSAKSGDSAARQVTPHTALTNRSLSPKHHNGIFRS